MQDDEKGNDRAKDNASQKTTQNGSDESDPSKREHLISILEVGGGLIFGSLAVACSEAGFHIWGFFFGYLAVVCGLAIVAHYLQKIDLEYVKTGFVVSLILMAILFGCLAFHEPMPELKPHPHFTFSVCASNAPDDVLELTNKFLMNTNFGKVGTSLFAAVVFPKPSSQSDIGLNFMVVNDSLTVAEDIEVSLLLDPKINCIPDPGWSRAKNESLLITGKSGTNKMPMLRYFITDILPGNGKILPKLFFPQATTGKENVVDISVRAKDSDTIDLFFGLTFFPDNLLHKPISLQGTTNFDGRAIFSMPAEQFRK